MSAETESMPVMRLPEKSALRSNAESSPVNRIFIRTAATMQTAVETAATEPYLNFFYIFRTSYAQRRFSSIRTDRNRKTAVTET